MPEAFKSLLSTLAPALGLPEIAVRDDDPVSLLGIDDFEVSLRYLPSSDLVMLFTVVAPLPEQGKEQLHAALLDANTFFHGTQGFTLAARDDTGVTLQGVMPLRVLDSANIVTWVQNFLNVAEHWQAVCMQDNEAAAEAASSDSSMQQAMMRA